MAQFITVNNLGTQFSIDEDGKVVVDTNTGVGVSTDIVSYDVGVDTFVTLSGELSDGIRCLVVNESPGHPAGGYVVTAGQLVVIPTETPADLLGKILFVGGFDPLGALSPGRLFVSMTLGGTPFITSCNVTVAASTAAYAPTTPADWAFAPAVPTTVAEALDAIATSIATP